MNLYRELKHAKQWLPILTAMLFILAALQPARADGLIYIEGVYRQPSISHINVLIKDKVATTSLEQTFRNPLNKQVSATYVAPVPSGATLTNFAEQIDGQWVEAKIKTSDQAKADFNAAASQGKDAALASASVSVPPGLDPKTTFQTSLILPPQSERSVRLTYTEILSGTVGLTRYTYPLSNTNLTDEPVGDLLVDVKVIENNEIRAVYSPSHPVEVARADKLNADALYRAQNVVPSQDFELVYTQSSEKFGLNLASYRDPQDVQDKDGYFMLIAAPQLDAQKSEVIQKDFVFVLDRSGSMQGQKFDQAKIALKKMLAALNPGDRFTMIAFDDSVLSYSTELVALDQREKAQQWVTDLPIGGGTNINDSLLSALRTVDRTSNRPHIIVFLTDGQPTSGVTSISSILANTREAIRPQSRIYTIGVGADVNQSLLNTLAQENRGSALMIVSTEQLEAQLGKFYAAIGNPVLVDLKLDFGGMDVYDLYPNPLPDMFLGGQVVVTGRYRGSGAARMTLTGMINGQPHTSTFENIKFLSRADDMKPYQYVPRLWAQRKVDALIRKLEVNGPDQPSIEAVKALGLRYDIVTPYTSFVVTAPTSAPNRLVIPNNQANPPIPRTGLPFLYVDDYRTLNTLLMAAGASIMIVGLFSLAYSRQATQQSIRQAARRGQGGKHG